ncbi:gamma-glutamyltransferase [Paratissierella segnis]|jgi:gamma-glutamyltranspeptidase/glutathione hydrolase|uniref:Glutathione hydrolase proenzyme n=1 Tax=Paratissierella segnis TaxID=2763679 RepID=A0A926EVE1_9FIRM|nr:gamma-glutamyltransferase [Paratissierella segnis]MBC8588998.1 gamma-glutamyltransferase [Paratissierella segnis]
MSKKKLLSFFLVILLVISSTVGCTKNKPVDEPGTGNVTNQPEENSDLGKVEEEFKLFDENGSPLNPPRDAIGKNGIVSSERYEASKIGAEIIEKGGNAVDAAVATAFALGVCEPNASGLGGGGFMTLRIAETGETVFIDFREVAPELATPDMYKVDEEGNVIDNLSWQGGLAVGVPGEVAGLLHILEKYGTMSREEVIRPAIELATNGYVVTPIALGNINDAYETMMKFPELGEIYLNDGLPPSVGDYIKNPDLAKTLQIIIDKGADGFYKGEVADAIVESCKKYGGIISHSDLENYKVIEREPVTGSYRGYEIISSPPPSSGGTHLLQILNILENFDVGSMEPYSAEHMHLLSEAFKIAYADRAKYMGDPDYIEVPLNGLSNKDYAEKLAEKIDINKSQTYEADDPWKYEGDSTTHLSVADKDGNMVAITKTLNYYFGSGVCVGGYGFILNNQMDDFSPYPDEPNSVAPGKKPLSSMSPTMVLKDGKPFMVLGAPGGSSIFAIVAQTISNVIDFDMDMQEAISMPRIWDNLDNVITYQDGISEEEVNKLVEMGHEVYHMANDTFGYIQGALYKEDGTIHGGADPYCDSKAVGF